jgi:hypothetical protein
VNFDWVYGDVRISASHDAMTTCLYKYLGMCLYIFATKPQICANTLSVGIGAIAAVAAQHHPIAKGQRCCTLIPRPVTNRYPDTSPDPITMASASGHAMPSRSASMFMEGPVDFEHVGVDPRPRTASQIGPILDQCESFSSRQGTLKLGLALS